MYNPKIYIRDYGTPTERILAYSGQFEVNGIDARLLRGLVLDAENPVDGEEFLLLSGDAQSGGDVLELSGPDAGNLAITNAVRIRFYGSDVRFLRHLVLTAESGTFVLDGAPAILGNEIVMPAGGGAFSLSGGNAGLLRHLVLDATPGNFGVSGADVILNAGDVLLLSGDEQSGQDALLLSGDEQSGTDVLEITYSI